MRRRQNKCTNIQIQVHCLTIIRGDLYFWGGWRKGGGYKKYSVYQLKPLTIIFVDSIHIKKLEYNFDDKYIDSLLIHDGVDILLTEMCVFIPQSLNTCVCIPKALYMCVAIPKDLDMCVCIQLTWIHVFVYPSPGYVCLYPPTHVCVLVHVSTKPLICFSLYPKALDMCVYIPQALDMCACIPQSLNLCVSIPNSLDMNVCIPRP